MAARDRHAPPDALAARVEAALGGVVATWWRLGWLRDVVVRLVAIDLEWAATSLRLPRPDGRRFDQI